MMSSAFTYVDNPNPNLVCCICRNPFLNPCTARTCSHTFCYDCVARAIAVSRQCPVDRCPLFMDDLGPADPVVRNLVDELIVECPNRALGCSYTCQRLLLSAHVTESCKFLEVPCVEEDCDDTVLRKDLGPGAHQQKVASVDHDTEPAQNVDSEINTASNRLSNAPSEASSAGDSHADASSSSDTTSGLAIENALLRQRILALEGIVNTLTREMSAVRAALGPWCRPHGSGSLRAEGHVAESLTLSHMQNTGASTVSTPSPGLPQITSPVPRNNSSTTDGVDADIASYFPPEDNEGPSIYELDHVGRQAQPAGMTAPPTHRRHSTAFSSSQNATFQYPTASPAPFSPTHTGYPPLTHPQYPYPYASYPPPPSNPPPISVTVPPLDPASSPLHSTLTSMHASLLGLSSALEGVAGTRAADMVQVGEEMRGLRAGMHGLRMQLHEVMTSSSRMGGSANGGGAEGEGLGSAGMSGTGGVGWLPFGARMGGPHFGLAGMPGSVTKL